MIDVFSDNFEIILPEIKDYIEKACFIAIDTEFTGLVSSKDNKPSLFDTAEQRYHKLLRSVSKYVICQFGLAIFTNESEANRYRCNAYNFYLHPPSFGSLDNSYSCQPSSLQFLTCHGFDFNKFVVRGVPYLRDDEEEIVMKEIKHKTFFLNAERHLRSDDELQILCSAVAQWISSSKESELSLDKIKGIRDYIQLSEIRQRFPTMWASINENDKILVWKVSDEERLDLEQQSIYEDEKIVASLLGFTQVFRLLVQVGKPIVGHNMLMDLLFMHHQFYKTLPKSYKTFKAAIHKLFPEVYDTKHISFSNRKKLENVQMGEMGSLEHMYKQFHNSTHSVLYIPQIVMAGHTTNDAGPEIKPHEAGFDAYAAGFVFIRTAHALFMDSNRGQPVNGICWRDHRNSVLPFANQVNLIRAVNSSMNLSGPDPVPERPQWLVLQSKGNMKLNCAQVSEMLSTFGCVDVKVLYTNNFLLAVSTFGCARDILRAFRHHEAVQVSSYNRLRHCRPLRLFLWSSLLASSCLSAFFVFKLLRASTCQK